MLKFKNFLNFFWKKENTKDVTNKKNMSQKTKFDNKNNNNSSSNETIISNYINIKSNNTTNNINGNGNNTTNN